MSKENIMALTEEDLENVSGGSWTSFMANRMAGDSIETGDAKDMEKNIRESRAKKWGELEIITATAVIAVPVTIAVSTLAKWGCDRLTRKLDRVIDGK